MLLTVFIVIPGSGACTLQSLNTAVSTKYSRQISLYHALLSYEILSHTIIR